MIDIREATELDAESIASLSRELGYEASVDETRQRIASLHSRAEQCVFVADDDGVVVGWCHVAVVNSLVHDPFVEIRGLVVTESKRGAGIGRLLVEKGEQWTRARGIDDVRLRSNVVRDGARHFYESIGYRVTKTSNLFQKTLSS